MIRAVGERIVRKPVGAVGRACIQRNGFLLVDPRGVPGGREGALLAYLQRATPGKVFDKRGIFAFFFVVGRAAAALGQRAYFFVKQVFFIRNQRHHRVIGRRLLDIGGRHLGAGQQAIHVHPGTQHGGFVHRKRLRIRLVRARGRAAVQRIADVAAGRGRERDGERAFKKLPRRQLRRVGARCKRGIRVGLAGRGLLQKAIHATSQPPGRVAMLFGENQCLRLRPVRARQVQRFAVAA